MAAARLNAQFRVNRQAGLGGNSGVEEFAGRLVGFSVYGDVHAVVVCALVVAAGCGDNIAIIDLYAPASGTRLKLGGYLYQDGTRQLDPSTFYDARLHAGCAPVIWTDGLSRCVPGGGDTVFLDAECTMEIGRTHEPHVPAVLVRTETIAGRSIPTRAFLRGPKTETPVANYVLREGMCEPLELDPSVKDYYLTGAVLFDDDLVAFEPSEVGDARVGLRIVTTADGLRAPVAFHDRELEIECSPATQADGSSACVPVGVPSATVFADQQCTEPAVAVVAPNVPAIVAAIDATGCTSYHTLGAPAAELYARTATGCNRVFTERAFTIGAPIDAAPIDRTIEADPDRRIQRIETTSGGLRAFDDRLYDTAMRAECERHTKGEISRCLPIGPPALRVYATSRCSLELRVAEVVRPSCTEPAFALAETEDGVDVHAIGEPYVGELYQRDTEGGPCQLHVTPFGAKPHALGPALPIDTFLLGIKFGDRQ